MKSLSEAIPRRSWRFGVDTGLFFLLFSLYVWLVIDPRLIHHSLGILAHYYHFSFTTGWPFFGEHLARPGGAVQYGTRFLSQLYCLGWAGTLILTAAALSMCLCTDVLTRRTGRCRGRAVRYGPAVLLLVMYGRYTHPLSTVLSVLVSLLCFTLYLRLAPQGTGKRLAAVLLLCVALYQVAGAGSLLFAALVAVDEFLIGRRMLVGATAVLCGLGVPWVVGIALMNLDVGEAYGRLLISDPGLWRGWYYALVLCVFFPAVLAGAAFRRGKLGRRGFCGPGGPEPKTASRSTGRAFRFLAREESKWAVRMAVVLLGAGGAAWFSLDAPGRIVLQIDYHSLHEDWTEALCAADRMPSGTSNLRCNRNIMQALHHTGRLGDEMFRYPQTSGVDLFSTPEGLWDAGSYFQESRLFLDLGQVNQAEKCACEALETTGDLPAILRHLAMINVVKERPEAARIFLNALGRKPLYRRSAREMLRRLSEDPRLESDPRVRKIRRDMVGKDSVSPQRTVEDFLGVLLEKNPHNKMAFEFLMAHFLCNGRPDQVVASLGRLKDFAYREIPRHYQEAIVVYWRVAGRRPWTPGYRLEPEIINRAGQFAAIMTRAPSRDEAARRALAAGFGDTYFFYYTFGTSGL